MKNYFVAGIKDHPSVWMRRLRKGGADYFRKKIKYEILERNSVEGRKPTSPGRYDEICLQMMKMLCAFLTLC